MNDDAHLPSPEAHRIALAFLTPSARAKQSTLGFLPGARRQGIDTPEGRLATAEWGSGPAVLLLHGWEGGAGDLAAFAPPLLAAGFRVIAMDLPAHGESPGERTSIPASARAVVAAQDAWGALHAVVAHSLGSAVAVEAMGLGLQVGRVALISAPARYAHHARGFAAMSGLPTEQADDMLAALMALGVDARSVSMPRRARTLQQPALFVHSADDRIVAIEESLESAAAWSGSRFLRLDGLGHRRILQSPDVVTAISDFVTDDEKTA